MNIRLFHFDVFLVLVGLYMEENDQSDDSFSTFRMTKGMLGVFLCTLVPFTQIGGVANTWGTLVIYIASYLRQYSSAAALSSIAMAFPIQALAWSLGMSTPHVVTGTYIYHHCGGRVAIALGVFPIVLGTVLASFVREMYLFLGVYLGLTGYGASNVVINAMWVGWGVMKRRKGLASGITMLGFGLGASGIGLGFSLAMNPENDPPTLAVTDGNQHEHLFPPQIAERLPWTLRGAAIVYTAVGLLGLLLLEDRSAADERRSLTHSIASSKKEAREECPSLTVAVKTSAFWNLLLYSFCTNAFEMFMLVEYKNYAFTVSHNDQLLSIIGSVGLLCNTGCRFVVASLMDYIPFKTLSMIVMLMQVSLAITMHLVVSYETIYAIWVCLTFMCFAATFAPIALICGQIFGPV